MLGAAFPTCSFLKTSRYTERSYEIIVELPNRYHRDDKAYPLVVVLDGQWAFGAVRDAFRVLALDRQLPEAVVVGIAHVNRDLRDLVQNRARDFTPTKASAPLQTGVRIPADEVGNASAFRTALAEEILPETTAGLRLSGDRTLVGHSFSALFGLDTLLTDPTMFHRWVLTSPSVWWDDRVMFRREANHAAMTDDLAARVFISAGSEEGEEKGFGGHHDFFERLAARNYPSLDLSWALFPGENHTSVISGAVNWGLRQVFAESSQPAR